MIADTAVSGRVLPITVAPTTKTVVPPGLLRPGGNTMRDGLLGLMTDGTMTDEGAIMMIEESLTLIMTAAGMMTVLEGMTVGAMKKTTVTMIDLQDMPMEMVVGLARWSFAE